MPIKPSIAGLGIPSIYILWSWHVRKGGTTNDLGGTYVTPRLAQPNKFFLLLVWAGHDKGGTKYARGTRGEEDTIKLLVTIKD